MNKIVTIQGIDKCTSLKNLELSFNQIASINALPPSLQTLDLSGNLLTSCSFLANQEKLEFLNLNHNKFTNLKSMPKLLSLDYLDVSENQLTLLGVWLQDYPNLRSLNISSNQLDSMFEVYCLIPTENFEVLFCLNNPFIKNFSSQEDFRKNIIGSFEGLRQLNGENIIRETPKMRRLKQMVQKLEESEVSDLDELIEDQQKIKEGIIKPKQPLIKEIDMAQIEQDFNQIKNKFQNTNLSIHETYQRKVKLLEELGLVENVEALLKQLEEQDQEMKKLESLEQENEVKEEEYLYPRPPQFPKSGNRPLTPIQEAFEEQNQEKSRPSSSRGSTKRKIIKEIKEQAKEIQPELSSQGRSTPQKPISKTRERIVSALAFKLDQVLKK